MPTALSRRAKQPVYHLIKQQGRSIGVIADTIGVPYLHLRSAVYGLTHPSPILREELPKLLGVPLEQLFDAEVLAGEYDKRRARRWAK